MSVTTSQGSSKEFLMLRTTMSFQKSCGVHVMVDQGCNKGYEETYLMW